MGHIQIFQKGYLEADYRNLYKHTSHLSLIVVEFYPQIDPIKSGFFSCEIGYPCSKKNTELRNHFEFHFSNTFYMIDMHYRSYGREKI